MSTKNIDWIPISELEPGCRDWLFCRDSCGDVNICWYNSSTREWFIYFNERDYWGDPVTKHYFVPTHYYPIPQPV